MTPVEKGRFCGSCEKQVVDFTNMSDREIAIFFKKPSTGSVCGRFMQEQLDRDIVIPKKRIPWLKYFFQFVLPAFLVSAKATAQGKVRVKENMECIEKNSTAKIHGPNLISKPTSLKISESIKMDSSDFPTYHVRGQVSVRLGGVSVKKNDEPLIILDGSPMKNSISLKNIDVNNIESITVLRNTESMALFGEVSINGVVLIQTKKRETDLKNDTVFNLETIQNKNEKTNIFKLYPNPIKSGTTLNIEWRKNETGNYKLELFNLSGQLIFSKEMWIDEEARSLNIQIPQVAAGNYFLRMTNKTSGKAYTEKIIIQ
jgi:hypothetical protein